MSDEVITGIVILSRLYKENDALVTILTDKGRKITFKGKGIMRITSKNSGSCQMFTKAEYCFVESASNYKTLKTAKLLWQPKQFFSSMVSSISAMVLCELIDKMTYDDQVNPAFFTILEEALFRLDVGKNSLTNLLIAILKLIEEDGIKFLSDGCCNCGQKRDIVSINLAQGGFLCLKCQEQTPRYSVEFLKTFRYLLKAELQHADSFAVEEDNAILILANLVDYLEHNCGLIIKTAKYITASR